MKEKIRVKKLTRFYITFILGITALSAYSVYAMHKAKAEQRAKAGFEDTLYSVIEKMKEDRETSKKNMNIAVITDDARYG